MFFGGLDLIVGFVVVVVFGGFWWFLVRFMRLYGLLVGCHNA